MALIYTVIHNHLEIIIPSLSVGYARRLNPLKCAYFDRLRAAIILIKGLLSKFAKLIILKKNCFEQKNAWSRFVLIPFKLHEIWAVDFQEIIKIVATRCHILKLKCTKFDSGPQTP